MVTRRTLLVLLASGLAVPARAQGLPLAGLRQDGTPLPAGGIAGWKLVYFGYTHCPDVCPMGLHAMSEAIRLLGPLGERITPVFVSVDPERDTPAVLREYVGFFHPRLVGLSPSAAELEEMRNAWRIKFAKVAGTNGGPYTVDHTSTVFMIDPSGQIVGRLSHTLDGQTMADKIRSVFLRS